MTYLVPDGLYYKLNAATLSLEVARLNATIAELKYKAAEAHHAEVEAEFHDALTDYGKYEIVGHILVDETHREVERKLVENDRPKQHTSNDF